MSNYTLSEFWGSAQKGEADNKNHFAEMEYCIGTEFQSKGLVTEATKAVIKYGFTKMNLHKVQISHKSINLPSKRVIEK